MTIQVAGTTVVVLGKTYQLKCADEQALSLQKAAEFLDGKMREAREVTHVLSVDRIAVLAALSISHQLMQLEEEKQNYTHSMNERLRDLQSKIDGALARSAQMELPSVD
jgi:cell division protein ZapA